MVPLSRRGIFQLLSGRLIGVCSSLASNLCLEFRLAIQPDIPLHRVDAQEGLLVPVSGVDEAEGRDSEQVGYEEITGNRLTRTPSIPAKMVTFEIG